jgi:hypothetical protein
MRDYFIAVARSWWNAITAAGVVLALVAGVSSAAIPSAVWIALLVIGVFFAQVQAFRTISAEHRDTAIGPTPRARAPRARAPRARAEHPRPGTNLSPALDPLLLQGRIYPYMYMSAVDSTEKAFCVRSAAAVRVPDEHETFLDTDDEHRLLDAVAASRLNAWIVTATSRIRTGSASPLWHSIYPTTSTVITLQLPPVDLLFGGWTVEGRVGYNLRPYGSTGAAGTAWVNVDVAIRPEGSSIANRPVSLEDLFSVICAELSTVLDDGLAGLSLAGISRPSLLAVATVVVTTGARLGDFVLMMRPSWHQAEGALEALGGEWPLRDYADVEDPIRRAETVRTWIKTLLRDSGISGHEADVDRFGHQ